MSEFFKARNPSASDVNKLSNSKLKKMSSRIKDRDSNSSLRLDGTPLLRDDRDQNDNHESESEDERIQLTSI